MKNTFSKPINWIKKRPFIFGIIIFCIFLYAVCLFWLINYLIKESNSWIYRRAYTSDFYIDGFPSRYRFELDRSTETPKRLDYDLWMTIWYTNSYSFEKYEFKNDMLKPKAASLITVMQIPHPIWTEPGITAEQLNRLPTVEDFSSFVHFNDMVDQITIRDTRIGQEPEWQQKAYSWEILQTQSKVMFLYLIYLDQQNELPSDLLDELSSLIVQIGQIDWYQQFQRHLDVYWS